MQWILVFLLLSWQLPGTLALPLTDSNSDFNFCQNSVDWIYNHNMKLWCFRFDELMSLGYSTNFWCEQVGLCGQLTHTTEIEWKKLSEFVWFEETVDQFTNPPSRPVQFPLVAYNPGDQKSEKKRQGLQRLLVWLDGQSPDIQSLFGQSEDVDSQSSDKERQNLDTENNTKNIKLEPL